MNLFKRIKNKKEPKIIGVEVFVNGKWVIGTKLSWLIGTTNGDRWVTLWQQKKEE
jgi:hypothetical protein